MSHLKPNNFRYPIDKFNPFMNVENPLNGEYWTELTNIAAPDILPSYYMISNYGRIYHCWEHNFMSLSWDGPGYTIAVLRTFNGSKTFRVHRLVMLTFRYFEGCDDYLVDHINGDKSQNWIDLPVLNPNTGQYELKDNLRWATKSENLNFRYNDPIQIKFANINRNAQERITKETAEQICILLQQGLTLNEIVNITNTTYNIVNNIKHGYSWTDISKNYKFSDADRSIRNNRSLSEIQVKKICEMLEENKYSYQQIADEAETTKGKVASIAQRECYTDISKNYNFEIENKKASKLSKEDVHEVCKMLKEGIDCITIANKFNVSKDTIYSITSHRSHKDISKQYGI